jgi:LacI family transcriptional regulator
MKRYRVGIMLELIWPYRRHLDVFAGTQRFANEAGDWDSEIDEIHVEESLKEVAAYDGIIARASEELAKRAEEANVPLVNVWNSSPVAEQLHGVFPDFHQIGREAAEHLWERGFRTFGCLSRPREKAHQNMIAGFHEVLESNGFGCNCNHVSRFYYRAREPWNRFQQQLDQWIASWKPPIALFVAFNDVTIRYVVRACHRNGLRVPEDVSLIGGTNEPMICTIPPPSLTSVELSYEQNGYQAAKVLDELMKGKPSVPHHILIPPTGIIARDSTHFFAVDDDMVAEAMRFIEKRVHDDIDVDDVAKAVGTSRRTLERRFRVSCNRTIAKEILRLRILKAKRLLTETDMLVKQIANESGFNSPIRLHEAFMREEGFSPTEFRRKTSGI